MKSLFFLPLVVFMVSRETAAFQGVLLERGTRRPLADLNVYVLPYKLKATSDAHGVFAFDDVPSGEIQLVVNAAGYQRLEKTMSMEAIESSQPLRLFLERASYSGLEATVVGKVAKRDDTTKTLSQDKFLTLPGSGGDPVKSIQNLPGVARVSGVSSQVLIQGSAPQDTIYHFEDHEVPLIFHFGGLTSVVMPEAVSSVDYSAAGYGPEKGRAMGGIVGLQMRDPATDRAKGLVFMDTTKAGGLIEGPINDVSSYLISGRYSYLGEVLKTVLKNNSSSFDLTVAPSFGDINVVYKLKASGADDIRVTTLYSHDELSFLFKEPARTDPGLRGNFNTVTNFYRVVPQWIHRFSDDSLGRLSLGIGQNMLRVDVGTNYFDLNDVIVSQRAEFEHKPWPGWTSIYGLDNMYNRTTVDLRLPRRLDIGGVDTPISTSDIINVSITVDDWMVGPYWRNSYRAEDSRWTWAPSVRGNYFKLTNEIKPEPRMALRYDYDDTLHLKIASGIYYQEPQPQEISPQYGNPDLKAPFAVHYTFGAEKDLRGGASEGFKVASNFFYRVFQNLVVNSTRLITRDGVLTPEVYNNEGRGRSFGIEFLLQYDSGPWNGWLAYTLSRSVRNEPGQEEHLFQYDQTHNVNLVVSREFGGNWKVSGRARFVTGNPSTPVTGASFDTDNDVYVPTRGAFFSVRDQAFIQLDGRVDKKWIYDTWILWGYLDIQNLSNQKNSQGLRYAYDYSQKANVSDLPILPTIGIKGEF
jgi:hypothetical protein